MAPAFFLLRSVHSVFGVAVGDYEGGAGHGWTAAPEHRATHRCVPRRHHHARHGTRRPRTTQQVPQKQEKVRFLQC